MRQAKVLYKNEEAGVLIQHHDGSFTFRYHDAWMMDHKKRGVSLTLPKNSQEYHSQFLFPFFYNMLPEGSNRMLSCKSNRIDKDDYFGLLMAMSPNDVIGAITVKKINENE